MRLYMDSNKLMAVKSIVQDYVNMTDQQIENFIDGGDEGWEYGDDEQQEWIDDTPADKIAGWVIASYVPQE